MASSLEWEVPTVSQQKIAGKILNLMTLLEKLWSLSLKFVSNVTYDEHNDDEREEHATWHHTSSRGSFCLRSKFVCPRLQCTRILVVTRSVYPSRNVQPST